LGYVEKLPDGAGYQLSPKGLYFADRLSSSLKSERAQPKIITIVALRNRAGQFLLHTEHRQPYIDTARLPAGKIHNDEYLPGAAKRELKEKLDIAVDKLSPAGNVHVRVRLRGELTSEYYGFIFAGKFDGKLPKDALWHTPNRPSQIKLMPSVREILNYIQAGEINTREYDIDAV
jgi:8-oxo-dGTP pyrophosphatase MutT (NUDIX family)